MHYQEAGAADDRFYTRGLAGAVDILNEDMGLRFTDRQRRLGKAQAFPPLHSYQAYPSRFPFGHRLTHTASFFVFHFLGGIPPKGVPQV